MTVFPIQFCVDETKFRPLHPAAEYKTRPFSSLIPGDMSTYVYKDEDAYYQQYAESYYALTRKKAGWDCMRHLEIVAAGCVPYFEDLDECPPKIMHRYPKDLIWQAMHLPGVNAATRTIDMTQFPLAQYEALRRQIYDAFKTHASCRGVAQYVLDTIGQTPQSILFLSGSTYPDYQKDGLLTGFKRLLGADKVCDAHRISHLHQSYRGNTLHLYGRGFSYSKVLEEDPDMDRSDEAIVRAIENRAYDLVVYGSIHRGLPFHTEVVKHYGPHQIVYVCGEDSHDTQICKKFVQEKTHAGSWLFVRELV